MSVTVDVVHDTATLGAVQTIQLKIDRVAEPLEVSLDKPVFLGRLDPIEGVDLVIDLEAFGGLEKGVSRCHARLVRQDDALVIEDLGSRNGTFVNAQRLEPHQPEALQDGDYLHLGLMMMQIVFSR